MTRFVFVSLILICVSLNLKAQIKTKVFISDSLLISSDLVHVEGWLFVKSEMTKYGIRAYNAETGDFEYRFAPEGRGPGEYLAFSIQRGPGEGTLEISDVGNRKNELLNVDCLKRKPSLELLPQCIIATIPHNASRQALKIEEDLMLQHGRNVDGVVYTGEDKEVSEILVRTPENINELYDRGIHEVLSQTGSIVGSPDRNNFAYFADSFDRAVFFERSSEKLEAIREIEATYLPSFEVKDFGASSFMQPSEEYKAAFYSPVSGYDNYFVIYSGKTNDEVDTELRNQEGAEWRAFSNKVFVYDFEGRKMDELIFDRDLFRIEVDLNQEYLFAIQVDRSLNYNILKAKLN